MADVMANARRGSWVDRGLIELFSSEPEGGEPSYAAAPCGACGCRHCHVATIDAVTGHVPTSSRCQCRQNDCPCVEATT